MSDGPISEADYFSQRLESQQKWHSVQASKLRKTYEWLKYAELFLAALIPVAALVDTPLAGKYTAAGLGVAVVVLGGVLATGKHQERWLRYRATSESLKRLSFLYRSGAAPYSMDKADRFQQLVVDVENLLDGGNQRWLGLMSARSESKTSED